MFDQHGSGYIGLLSSDVWESFRQSEKFQAKEVKALARLKQKVDAKVNAKVDANAVRWSWRIKKSCIRPSCVMTLQIYRNKWIKILIKLIKFIKLVIRLKKKLWKNLIIFLIIFFNLI